MSCIVQKGRAFLRSGLELVGVRRRMSFALEQLDIKLLDYIKFARGIFVEAGANDGLTQSNTAYFEQYRGWRGLLIEPIPQLVKLCAANRPLARVEQCALVPFDFGHSAVTMRYCNLMSIVEGARGSPAADMTYLINGRQWLSAADQPYTLQVPARTLTDVLASHRIKRIDFLSLDVEGFEAPALMGLDFSRFSPTWILVEANDRRAIETILMPRYAFVAALSDVDRLYHLR